MNLINNTFNIISYLNSMLSDDLEHFSLIMLAMSLLIVLYAYIGHYLEHRHFHFIHETGVGILIGFLFGLIIYFSKAIDNYNFNEEVFFYGLLPPMIFAGGYNLKKSEFFQNFSYISLFGALGTLVTFLIIFGLTYLINYLKLIRQWENINTEVILPTSLIIKYSATICASDSVAALTMIKPNKYPKLFSIVFGEGMINDAVAIILFKVVGGIFSDEDAVIGVGTIFNILLEFLINISASLAIGGGCALICSKIFQLSPFLNQNPIVQVAIMFTFGIMSYVIAEVADMSGVITVLVCGICLAHFNFYNLSITGQIATGVTFQTISYIAEAFVFIYLGISCMFYVDSSKFSYTFILLELLICAFARFITIFGLSFIFKFCVRKWNVSFYELLIVTVAGIIRGSVAFALILTLQKGGADDVQVRIIQSSVMVMVFITTISLGAIMPFFITKCLQKDEAKRSQEEIQQLIQETEQKKGKKQKSKFSKFDQTFLKPFFIRDYLQRKQKIAEFKKLLKLNSPQYKGGQYSGLLRANVRQTLAQSNLQMYSPSSLYTDEDLAEKNDI